MEPEKKSNGAFIGLIIIIIILVVGGIYIWMSNKDALDINPNTPVITEQDTQELDSLEMEAQATDTDTGVDANSIE